MGQQEVNHVHATHHSRPTARPRDYATRHPHRPASLPPKPSDPHPQAGGPSHSRGSQLATAAALRRPPSDFWLPLGCLDELETDAGAGTISPVKSGSRLNVASGKTARISTSPPRARTYLASVLSSRSERFSMADTLAWSIPSLSASSACVCWRALRREAKPSRSNSSIASRLMRSRSSGDALCFRSFHASVFMTESFPEAVASKGYCHIEVATAARKRRLLPPQIFSEQLVRQTNCFLIPPFPLARFDATDQQNGLSDRKHIGPGMDRQRAVLSAPASQRSSNP